MSEALIHVPDLFSAPAGASLVLEVGYREVPAVLGSLAKVLLTDGDLYCVDAANCFDPYAFANQARRHGVIPQQVLERVWITRAFTIHQLAAAAATMLPQLAEHTPRPFVAVLGLEHLFLEESLRLAERRQVLSEVLEDLGRLEGLGLRLLVTHEPPDGDAWWLPAIAAAGTIRARVSGNTEGRISIHRRWR